MGPPADEDGRYVSKAPQSWLPNLVGGVSIWKLASDLNDPKHFDGRLLEPETEGSDSLPTKVSWDLTGMVPLVEARQRYPEDAERAIGAFVACLERVSEEFDDESSGYHKFKDAFTVPSLAADEGGHYHYHPEEKKLYVINWGASPRTLRQEQNYLFGYGSFDKLYDREAPDAAAVAGGAVGQAATGAHAGLGAEATEGAPAEGQPVRGQGDGQAKGGSDEKDGEQKEDGESAADGRPWWFWVLIALVGIALIVAVLMLLDQCEDPAAPGGAGGAGAAAGGAGGATPSKTADGGTDAGQGGAGGKGGAKGAGGAGGKGGAEGAGGAGGSGGKGGSGEGGAGGGSGDPDDFEAPVVVVPTGSGAGPGKVIVINPGGGTPSKSQPHRVHFHPQAKRWRIAGGHRHVDRIEAGDGKYDVHLLPGRSFSDVKVQWQDAAGRWHDH